MTPGTNTAPAITAPYPGLRPFERHENILFFGREEQVDQLLDKLGESHFLAVLGLSGSGKSSLVRAGLLPALEGGALVGAGARWQVAELRPGDHPMARLARALRADTPWGQAGLDDPDALEEKLRRGSQALNWLLGVRPLGSPSTSSANPNSANSPSPASAPGQRLLILVDQFEELFRYHNQSEAAAFVALLLAAASHPDVYIIITMRSEFLGACSDYPDLPEAINAGLFLTPALTPEQLLDAIEFPIRLSGFAKEGQQAEVAQELARALLADAQGIADPLPLLQHALLRLWNVHEKDGGDGVLTLARYRELGGLQQALNDHLDAAFDELDPEHRRIAEVMFRALTEHGGGQGEDPDDSGRDTRRPARVSKIARLAGVGLEEITATTVPFRQPGRNFLIPQAGQGLNPNTVLDIAHEALIRQWDRLKEWTADEGEQADLYRRLAGDARRHAAGEAALWIDPALQIALDWWEKNTPSPTWAARYGGGFDQAKGFLNESLAVRAARQAEEEKVREARRLEENARRQQAEEEARRKRELERARRVALGAVLGLLVVAVLALWANVERNRAVEAEREAKVERNRADGATKMVKAERDRAVAAEQNAKEAKQRAEKSEEIRTRALFDSALTHAALLARVEDPMEGRRVLAETVALDADISPQRRHARNLLAGFLDLQGGTADKIYDGAGAVLIDLALSPDGRTLVAAGERGTLALFHAESGKLIERLVGHDPKAGSTGSVTAVRFNRDGSLLYSAGDDGQILRWSMPEGKRRGKPWRVQARVYALALSPDGKLLASGNRSENDTLWSTDSGEKIKTLKIVARGVSNKKVTIDVVDTRSLAFISNNQLVTGDSKGNVAIWRPPRSKSDKDDDSFTDPGDPRKESSPHIHTGEINTITIDQTKFQADGKYNVFATGGADKRIVLWRPALVGAKPFCLLQGHANRVVGLRFVPGHGQDDKESRRLLSASRDNTMRLWDLESGTTLRIFQGLTAGLQSVVVDDKRGRIYTAANDGTIRRWPLATPSQWLWDISGEPISAAIDPAGRLVSVGFRDGTLRFYPLPAAVGGSLRSPQPTGAHGCGRRRSWFRRNQTHRLSSRWQVHSHRGYGCQGQTLVHRFHFRQSGSDVAPYPP
uniref:WD40 repeat n=1 Tax=Candidatus Kentrum sp. FW TaxID=2126338 RepID=A0A450ST66_9GAMM|nr:MAG: WD40 repeat [Candidatus Kentron sp. FW]